MLRWVHPKLSVALKPLDTTVRKKNLIWLGKEKAVGGLSRREAWGPGTQVGAPGLLERGVERA